MFNKMYGLAKSLNRQAKEHLIKVLKMGSRGVIVLMAPVPIYAVKEILAKFGPDGVSVSYVLLLLVSVFTIMVTYGAFQLAIIVVLDTVDD